MPAAEALVILESEFERCVPIHVAALASVLLAARASVVIADLLGITHEVALYRLKALIDFHAKQYREIRVEDAATMRAKREVSYRTDHTEPIRRASAPLRIWGAALSGDRRQLVESSLTFDKWRIRVT